MERVPSADVGIFVTAVQIQYRIGGNLSGILRTIGQYRSRTTQAPARDPGPDGPTTHVRATSSASRHCSSASRSTWRIQPTLIGCSSPAWALHADGGRRERGDRLFRDSAHHGDRGLARGRFDRLDQPRRLRLLLLMTALAALVTTTPAWAAQGALEVVDVRTDGFPRVAVLVNATSSDGRPSRASGQTSSRSSKMASRPRRSSCSSSASRAHPPRSSWWSTPAEP